MPWFHCDHLYLKRQSQEKQQVSVLSSVPSFFSLMEKWQWAGVLFFAAHSIPLNHCLLHFTLSSYIETLMILSCRQQHQPFPVSTGPTVLPGDSSVPLFFSFSFFMVSSSTPVHFVQASGPSHNPLLLSRWSGLQIYRKTLSTLDKESERLLLIGVIPPVFLPCPFGKADSFLSISVLCLYTLTVSCSLLL